MVAYRTYVSSIRAGLILCIAPVESSVHFMFRFSLKFALRLTALRTVDKYIPHEKIYITISRTCISLKLPGRPMSQLKMLNQTDS
jgi:hypothetical protein